jgi:hypothetical protein
MDYRTGVMGYGGKTIEYTIPTSEGNIDVWFNKLKGIAEKNPDGFTVDLLSLDSIPNKGYVVGLTNETLDHWQYRRYVEKWWLVATEEIKKYLDQNQHDRVPRITIGGWRNPEDGKYYVDVGLVIYNKDYAMELGKKYNQKAIFNLETFETINL